MKQIDLIWIIAFCLIIPIVLAPSVQYTMRPVEIDYSIEGSGASEYYRFLYGNNYITLDPFITINGQFLDNVPPSTNLVSEIDTLSNRIKLSHFMTHNPNIDNFGYTIQSDMNLNLQEITRHNELILNFLDPNFDIEIIGNKIYYTGSDYSFLDPSLFLNSSTIENNLTVFEGKNVADDSPPDTYAPGSPTDITGIAALAADDGALRGISTISANNEGYHLFAFNLNISRNNIIELNVTWNGKSDAVGTATWRMFFWNWTSTAYDLKGTNITIESLEFYLLNTTRAIGDYVGTGDDLNNFTVMMYATTTAEDTMYSDFLFLNVTFVETIIPPTGLDVNLESPVNDTISAITTQDFTCSAENFNTTANIVNVTFSLSDSAGALEAQTIRDLFFVGAGDIPTIDDNMILNFRFDNLSEFNENDTHIFNFGRNLTNISDVFGDAKPNMNVGFINGSWIFDGDGDRLEIPNFNFSSSLSTIPTANFTISMWVNSTEDDSDTDILFRGWNPTAEGLRIHASSGNVRFSTTGSDTLLLSTTNIEGDNLWHHIVIRHSSSLAELYLDGVMEDDDTSPEPFIATRIDTLQIGGLSTLASASLDGMIDEFIIWNRTLTPGEIRSLYLSYGYNTTANETFTVSSIPDDSYEWNCEYYDEFNFHNGSILASNSTILIDTINPIITITDTGTLFGSTSVPVNYTFVEANPQACTYSLNVGVTNNTFPSCGENATITANNGLNNFIVYINDTGGNVGLDNFNFTVLTQDELFNATNVLETSLQDFSMSVVNETARLISAELTYNGTVFPSTSNVSNGTTIFLNASVTLGLIPIFQQNHIFFWNTTFRVGATEVNVTSDVFTQTVDQMFIGNCTDGLSTDQTLNFSILDESAGTPINTTIFLAEFEVWSRTQSLSRVFNFDTVTNTTSINNATSFAYCIAPNFAQLTSDWFVQYGADGFNTREYHRDSDSINSTVELIDLFLAASGDTDAVTINVEDENGNELENVIVEAQLKDIGSGNFTIVDIQGTDPDGRVVMDLIRGDNFYKFLFKIDGVLKLETNEFKLSETEYFFVITIGAPSTTDIFVDINTIQHSLTFNNTGCNNFTFTWNDLTDIADSFKLDVSNVSYLNETATHSQTSTATSGTFTFTIGDPISCIPFNGTFLAQGFVTTTEDGEEHLLDSLTVLIRGLSETIPAGDKRDGALFSLIVVLTMFGIGMASGNPAIYIGMGVVGVWIMVITGLLSLTFATVATLAVIGMFYIWRLKT